MYEIHCPECGRTMLANELAFDFGELVNKDLEIQNNRRVAATDEWLFLNQFNLHLYLTLDDLIRDYHFIKNDLGGYQGNFKLTPELLGKHILTLTYNGISEDGSCTIDELFRNPQSPYYEQLFVMQKTGDNSEFLEALHDQLISKISIKNKQNMQNEAIVNFKVLVKMAQDDQGNSFANKLEITFQNGEIYPINEFVCKGEPGHPCGYHLYAHAGQFEEIVIGLAGTARVGKTAYLASVLSTIKRESNETGQKLGYRQDIIRPLIYSGDAYNEFYKSTIQPYVNGGKIAKTAEKAELVPKFSLTFNIASGGDLRKGKTYIFTFVDMPGETFDHIGGEGARFVRSKRRILEAASMIWFCLAPDQVLGYQTVAAEDRVNTDFGTVIKNIGTTMDGIHRKGQIPTAVIITKSDIIPEHFGLFNNHFNPYESNNNPMQVLNDKTKNSPWIDTNGVLNYSNMEWLINQTYSFLRGDLNDGANLTFDIHETFGKFSPFAVASYGFSVDNKDFNVDEDIIKLPQPSMIEAPFLWSLAVLGKIKVCREYENTYAKKKLFKTIYETRIELEPLRDEQELFRSEQ